MGLPRFRIFCNSLTKMEGSRAFESRTSTHRPQPMSVHPTSVAPISFMWRERVRSQRRNNQPTHAVAKGGSRACSNHVLLQVKKTEPLNCLRMSLHLVCKGVEVTEFLISPNPPGKVQKCRTPEAVCPSLSRLI